MADRVLRTAAPVHGGGLVVYGLSYVLLGVVWLTTDSEPWTSGVLWLEDLIPKPEIGWTWILGGTFAVAAGAISREHRILEAIGYAVATLLPVLLGVWYAVAWLFTYDDYAARSAALWLLVAMWVGWIGSRLGECQEEVVVP